MPLTVKIYIALYILFLVSNLGGWIYLKLRPWVIFYDLMSGVTFVLFMIAFFKPAVLAELNIFHAAVFIGLIAFEFYMSVWGDFEKLGIRPPEGMSPDELETAAVLSLIFSAPAYVIGGMACIEVLKGAVAA